MVEFNLSVIMKDMQFRRKIVKLKVAEFLIDFVY